MMPVKQSGASRIALNVMRLSLAAFLFAVLTRTAADADLWGHLRFGRDIVALKALPEWDRYSFTSDIPWINHEWLAEVIQYGSYTFGGAWGLVAVKSVLMLAMLGMVLASLRPLADDFVVHDLLVFLAVAGTYGRSLTFRPQVFSLLLFPALLLALRAAERGRPRVLLAVPIVFLLWANLHGGWIVGLAALGIWCGWTLIRADHLALRRSWVLAAGGASVLATLLNPYGLALWSFLGTTVGFSRDIADWQPLWKLPVAVLTPWITASVLAAAASYSARRRINPAHVAIVALCWAASIRVSRLDAFFVLSVVMLLGTEIRDALRRSVPSTPVPARRIRHGEMAFGIVAIGVAGMAVGGGNFRCVTVEAAWAPEPDAVLYAKANDLRGRMFTFFDWGEYAIWHLAPDIKVSIDGRRETAYSQNVIEHHFQLYRNKPEGLQFLDELQPDYIWLPGQLPVVKNLESRGWTALFAGSQSVILSKTAAGSRIQLAPSPSRSPRCFPGP